MMRSTFLLLSLLTATWVLTGCGEEFLNEEMQLGIDNKLRPLAVLCDPPEAAPGQPVTITLRYWDPDPDETEVSWRVALDFDSGIYEASPVERRYVDLDELLAIDSPIDTGDGFMTQSFTYIVPDSTLLWTSAIPDELDDGMWSVLADLVPAADGPPAKADLNALLAGLTAEDLAAMDPEERDLIRDLADLFACQIRFRARLDHEMVLDVTRNLTVRHSSNLGSPNVNANTQVTRYELVAVRRADVEHDDLDQYEDEIQRYPLLDASGLPVAVQLPANSGWTYYLETEFAAQEYTSPFSGDRLFEENAGHRWYTFRNDDGDPQHVLLRNEDGEDVAMYELDEWVRLTPPESGESSFRVFVCIRDERPEWSGYHATPGAVLAEAEITFTSGK
jgi:hypothetical protein